MTPWAGVIEEFRSSGGKNVARAGRLSLLLSRFLLTGKLLLELEKGGLLGRLVLFLQVDLDEGIGHEAVHVGARTGPLEGGHARLRLRIGDLADGVNRAAGEVVVVDRRRIADQPLTRGRIGNETERRERAQ